MGCSPVCHLLCSAHQERNSLWWISTKRFETYKERHFSQVCYLKPGNLGIHFTHRGSRGSLWCLSGWLTSGLCIEIKGLGAMQSVTDHILRWGLSHLLSLFFVILFFPPMQFACMCMCTVTVDGALSFPWVTHVIAAPSFFIPNSVGRACQTAYAERRGDFEMLLMTLGYNYPLSLTPPHSSLSWPLLCH